MNEGPKLKENQFALMMADGSTGHVLTTEGCIYLNDEAEIYMVFNDLKSVNEFIVTKHAEDNSIDLSIYNNEYKLIEFKSAPKWH